MIKSILGGKSKNLFDISKVVTSNQIKRIGNNLICSAYGISIGTLGSICPTLKPSDLITISFKCTSERVSSNFMSMSTTSGGNKIFTSGETFPVSEVGLSAQWYIYNTDYEHRDIPNKTTYSDIQVELGSAATEYVPHELTSYKSIMKVSDVCQLGDKRKYNASETKSGVTFTNNGDGTITVNGTSTQLVDFNLQFIDFIENHTYLLIGCPSGGSTSTYILDTGADIGNDTGNGTISKPRLIGNRYFSIYVYANTTCNNVIFKPQLFDLTEMFGAGNEPKTVSEFKAKFPNDYYPYSPSCFVTSFDERMPCKTKNLFDIPLIEGYPSDKNYGAATLRTFTIGTYVVGMIRRNNYEPSNVTNFNVSKNSISLKNQASGYGINVPLILTVGQTYTISCIADNNFYPGIGISYYKEDGTFIISTEVETITNNPIKSFTVPENTYYTVITFYGRDAHSYMFSNIQLELGTTATDYVPYGYV